MIFTSQDMEQLKAAQALFAKLAGKAAGLCDDWKDAGMNEHNTFYLDELAGVLDDMAVSVQQVLEDHIPELDDVAVKYAKRGPRAGWTKEDFELDRADTMRAAAV